MFDRDGNGFISKQELGMAMRSLGYMPNEVELEVIIQRLDIDGTFVRPLSASTNLLHSNICQPPHELYTVTSLNFCPLHQVTVKLVLKSLSLCLGLNCLLLECLISSTEQTSIQCFGRYVLSSLSSLYNVLLSMLIIQQIDPTKQPDWSIRDCAQMSDNSP